MEDGTLYGPAVEGFYSDFMRATDRAYAAADNDQRRAKRVRKEARESQYTDSEESRSEEDMPDAKRRKLR